jgi:hypothetical protein
MGIRDRDYMKRPSDDDGKGDSSSKAEELAQKFLSKFPQFLMYCGIGLVVLIVIALVILKFSGKSH